MAAIVEGQQQWLTVHSQIDSRDNSWTDPSSLWRRLAACRRRAEALVQI